jgi:allantoicase
VDSIACKSNYRQVILCINTRSGSTIMYYFDDDEGAKNIWRHVGRYNIYPSFGIARARFTFVTLRHFPSLQRYI